MPRCCKGAGYFFKTGCVPVSRAAAALPGIRRRVGPAVAFQLTTDRTRRPLQAARNYPQRAALLKDQLDQRAFFTAQVFVVRSHGNTLSPDKCCTSYLRPPPAKNLP